MAKVICMARCSTMQQELESQTDKLVSKAKSLGYTDDNIIIIEDKESGIKLDFEDREGISKLIETINTDDIERIIIYEISRLARRPDVFYKVREILISKKIQLDVLTPEFSMLNPDGTINENSNLLIGLFLSMAESEMRIKQARFKRGKERKKSEGKYVGGRILFGYKTDKNNYFIIDEDKAQVVRSIFERYNSGNYSARQLSKELYNEGIIKSEGKSGETFVCKLLRNSSYYDEKQYPPIITKSDYDKAGKLLDSYQIKARRVYAENVYYAHKILFVEENKRQMMVRKSDGAYVEPISGFHVNINTVDSLLLYCASKSIESHRPDDIKKVQAKLQDEMKRAEKRMKQYMIDETRLLKSIDKIEERLILGKITASTADVIEEKINKELHTLRESRQNDRNLINDCQNRLKATCKEYAANIDVYNLTEEDQARIIKEEIEKVWVTKVKNSWYRLRIKYKNPLLDGEIYELFTKKHKIMKYGKEVDIRIIDRIPTRRKKEVGN